MTLRITYIHQYFNTPDMTGGTRSYEMARRLIARGHEVTMITSARRGGPPSGVTVETGIRVRWLPVPYEQTMGYRARLTAFARFMALASRAAGEVETDVVFASSTPLTVAVPGAWAAFRQRAPLVFEVRDLWPDVPIAVGALRNPGAVAAARVLERFAYWRSHHVVVLSPGMRAGVMARGVPATKVTIIPNACDVEAFDIGRGAGEAFRAEHAWLRNRPLVVYVGTLGRVNGVGYLVRLARHVADLDADVRFLVVGRGSEWEHVRSEAEALGVLGRTFHMMPAIPKRDVPAVLSAADVATSVVVDVPVLEHNSANKFFDALASGTPVVINHRGWQEATLDESGAGMALDRHDLQASARRLVDLLRDRPRLASMEQAARRLATGPFARDALVDQLEQVLSNAVGKRE